jgi:hypothetical protein
MAVAVYATDLTVFKDLEAATTLGEMVGYTQTGAPALDTDYPIQGTQHASASMTKTGLGSIVADFGSGIALLADEVFLVWGVFTAPAAVDTFANGGLRILIGTDITTNWKGWKIGGSNFGRYPYGGWQNFAVDPTVAADYTGGTLGLYRWVGIGVNATAAIGKGVPVGLDCIRYGRGILRITLGDGTAYGTFSGMAAANDANTARWGLFQNQNGSYLWKGLMSLGISATAVDFRDSNATIFVDDTQKVSSAFNRIEVNHASSRVDWTNVNITALGTVSRGVFECVANADINKDSCVFTDMGFFSYQSNSTILSSTYRRTDQITTNGAIMTDCTFDRNRATTAVLASSPANAALVSACTFISDGTGYGMEITGTAANMTFTNNTWTGYAGSNGTTGNEAVFVNIATGSMNITISGGTTPSIRTAGATVTVISGAVTAAVNVKTLAGANLQNARVLVKADAGGPFPSDATVTITNSGTTATVTHTGHAMATNDKVMIKGASHVANNGVFTITVTNANTYTYTMGSTPGSNPTGTIKATFIVLEGLTDASGNISASRVYPSAQPVIGWARKSSADPYYKPAAIGGSVSSTLGLSASVQMIPDV